MTTASPDDSVSSARETDHATYEGTLLRHGEVAVIGREAAGRLIRERFAPGALTMPNGPAPLLDVGHDHGRIIGHLTSVWAKTARSAVLV